MPPRVYVSYSHDSEDHERRILEFTQDLRRDGIDAWIDQFEPAPPEGWPRWMASQVQRADFIVFACTPSYCLRYEGNGQPGTNTTVTWEAMLADLLLFEKRFDHRTLVPVLFEDACNTDIPLSLRAGTHHAFPAAYGVLIKHLRGEFGVRPEPLGGPKVVHPGMRSDPIPEDHYELLTKVHHSGTATMAANRMRCEIVEAHAPTDTEIKLLFVEPACEHAGDQWRIEFRIAFLRHRIPCSSLMRADISFAATGAWLHAGVDRPGIVGCSAEHSDRCKITSTLIGSARAEWSCDSCRRDGQEREFLEGNETLLLIYRTKESASLSIRGQTTGVVFVDAKGNPIESALKNLALRIKLWNLGARLLKQEVRHLISLTPAPSEPD
jgi:SEFIR domain